MNKSLKNGLIGLAIGTGAAAPGVSGGSLAVATGIYSKFFEAIEGLRKDWRKSLSFLIPLGIGGVAGLMLFVCGISYLLEYFEVPTRFAFFGLMIGTFPSVRARSDKRGFKWRYLLYFLIMAAATAATVIIDIMYGNRFSADGQLTVPLSALSGVIFGMGIIVPGVSASVILMSMGVYETIINAIKSIDIVSLWPFALAAGLTVIIFIKLVNWLFDNYYGAANWAFFGLLVGSTVGVLPLGMINSFNAQTVISIAIAAGMCILSYIMASKFEE